MKRVEDEEEHRWTEKSTRCDKEKQTEEKSRWMHSPLIATILYGMWVVFWKRGEEPKMGPLFGLLSFLRLSRLMPIRVFQCAPQFSFYFRISLSILFLFLKHSLFSISLFFSVNLFLSVFSSVSAFISSNTSPSFISVHIILCRIFLNPLPVLKVNRIFLPPSITYINKCTLVCSFGILRVKRET